MKRKTFILALLLLIPFLAGTADSLFAYTQPEAGFYTLEENDFYFHTNSYFNRNVLRSSPARMWYVYQPADDDPASKPLFVFFNGGPGGATSSGLLSAFTGRNAVAVDADTGIASLISNPASWTRIGNLLHIDARTTGFSYSLMDNPRDDALRQAEFDAQNYNSFIDGADFVRVLLRFLADHPPLQQNRVIIVPESYGGARTAVMLHLLLYYQNYANGQSVYQDPGLVREIEDHYNAVFPEYAGSTVPPSVIARQFSHQIMIQPGITRSFQRQIAAEMLEAPGSVIYQLAEETGVPYIPWRDQPGSSGTPSPYQIMNNIYDYLEKINRDPYMYTMPGGFLSGYFQAAADLLSHYAPLCRMTGMDVAGIDEMYASRRQGAYKIKTLDDAAFRKHVLAQLEPLLQKQYIHSTSQMSNEDDLTSVFGILQPWDRYFIQLNYDANLAFYLNKAILYGYDISYSSTQIYGQVFLESAAWVETFITNADLDMVVYSPAIPDAFALYSSILSGTRHDTQGPPGAARPGQIILEYKPSSVPGASVTTRTIRFPRYVNSGHAVTLTEPEEILADVVSWLEKTGVSAINRQGANR